MVTLPTENARIRELQRFHDAFDCEKQFDRDMIANAAYLAEEVGEVISAIRVLKRAQDDTTRTTAKHQLGEELADCLAYILKLANYAEIDLQTAYLEKMEHNFSRDWRTNQEESHDDVPNPADG